MAHHENSGCGMAGAAVQLLLVLLNLVMVFSIVMCCCDSLLHTAEMGFGCPSHDLSRVKHWASSSLALSS